MTKQQIQKRVSDLTAEIAAMVENWQELRDDMQSYFDDRSEKWQVGERGDEYQLMMDEIEQQLGDLENAAAFEVE